MAETLPAARDVQGTLIVGASAAGLATAAELRRRDLPFEMLEADASVGARWRDRYDRLHLHTPRSASGLPGLPMPRAWGRYPSRDLMVGYLEDYRRHLGIRPHYGEAVRTLRHVRGGWEAVTARTVWRASTVVLATGLAAVPHRPTWPGMEHFGGRVLHSSEYRNGAEWRGRTVLVVGFGNSACEQALDLVEHGAQAHLAVRSPVNAIPRDLFGLVPIVRLAILLGPLPAGVADVLSRPALRVQLGDLRGVGLRTLPYGPNAQVDRDGQVPLIDVGTLDGLRDETIGLHGEIHEFTEDAVKFVDGSSLRADAVVLATGYRSGLETLVEDWDAIAPRPPQRLPSGTPPLAVGLYLCGMRVTRTGMLREIGLEARRIGAAIAREA